MTKGRVLIVLASLVWGTTVASAAEIELRREARPAKHVVTLADVAVVHANDAAEAETLGAIELFPSPPSGPPRFLRVQELQDLLLLHGVPLQKHHLTGCSQVAIRGADAHVESGDLSLPPVVQKKAERDVAEAIARSLQSAGNSQVWNVAVHLDDAQAHAVSKAQGAVVAHGDAAPAVGRHSFEVVLGSGKKGDRFAVDATVSLPLSVVVTTRSLMKGAVVGPNDVRLQPAAPSEVESDGFRTVEEVLGSEIVQMIGEGVVLQKRFLHAPLLVHRGDIVTVYARAAGIRVRTTAKAREDGSQGDLLSVESLTDRKAYIARVCGIREMEVWARAPQSEAMASE